MSSVFSHLKSYKTMIAIALFLMIAELVVELWHPLLMAKIINEGIMQNDLEIVLIWGGFMILLSFLGFAAGIVNSFLAAHVSQSFGYDLRNHVFNKIQSFSFANLACFSTASLITRLTNDITQVQGLVFMALRIMARAPLLILGGIVMSLFVNWKIGMIFVITMPFLAVFIIWLMGRGVALFRRVQEKLDGVNSVIRENLAAMPVIRVFLRKNHEQRRFDNASHLLKESTIHSFRLIELMMPVLLFVMNSSILIVLWYGGIQVGEGKADIGEIVALVNYGTRITFAFSVFSFILVNFARARASATRIGEVLSTEVDSLDNENSLTIDNFRGKVAFSNVTFSYPNTTIEIIKGVSFTIQSGETVALLGATGSGKTSLFQLIPRLYEVSSGAIYFDNIDHKEIKLAALRSQIGFVPQEVRLFSGTIKDNICWGKEVASNEEIVAAAKAAQIHDTIMKMPNKYETVIGQKGATLSGGQKQRLSIARALIRKPKILLLDDSTSALDLQTERKILAAIKAWSCTVFIITQKISTVVEADQIILLEDGKVTAQGTHLELLATSKQYEKIVASQTKAKVIEND